MQHVLRAISGPHAGAVYVLGSRTTIGRASDCDIQILHEGVSRHHAKITFEDDGSVAVVDLSSDNGTFIDDERVERHVLRPGEVLRIMRSRFAYEALPAGDAETSAVFRRKVTSGDSLRQTVLHDKSSLARAGLAHPAGAVGERGRPHSRPQAAAPALSGARPGAAAAFGERSPEHEPPPRRAFVNEKGDEPGATPPRGPAHVAERSDEPGAAPKPSVPRAAEAIGSEPGPETVDEPPRVRRPGAPPRDDSRALVRESSVVPEVTAASRGQYGALGRGRRERVTAVPTSVVPPPSGSATRAERTLPPLPPSGPSGRMAPLSSSEPESRLSTAAGPTTGPMGSGWVRVTRPLATPGSMRPGSTLTGVQRVEITARPPVVSPTASTSTSTTERPARSSITAEYGAVDGPAPTEGAPTSTDAPTPTAEPATAEPAPGPATAVSAPEPAASVRPPEPAPDPDGDLDAMKTLPAIRRVGLRGSSTPTEEVPRAQEPAGSLDVDEESTTKTQPRVTLVPRGPEPASRTPDSLIAPAIVVAAPVAPSPAPIPAVPPSRRLTVSGGIRGSTRPLAYEDTLRFQRSEEPEPGRSSPAASGDVPQARPHATSAEIISALEALLPPGEAVPTEASTAPRPDAQTLALGFDDNPIVDAMLLAAVADDDDPWPADVGELSEVDKVELRAQQVLEQADREHKQREGLERLVDILEYRELRFRALHGQPTAAHAAARCTELEQVLQQRPPAGDDMAAMRRYHRFVCAIPAQLTHRPRGTTSTSSVEIEDLSAGGAKITFAEHSIGAGESVWLAIDLTRADRSRIPYVEAQRVVLKARVVWAQPHEASLGLIFAGAPRYDLGGADGPA